MSNSCQLEENDRAYTRETTTAMRHSDASVHYGSYSSYSAYNILN